MASQPRTSIGPVRGVHSALDALTALNPAGLTGAGQGQLLRDLKQIAARVDAYRLKVLAAADVAKTAQKAGAADVASWAAKAANDDSPEAARAARLAQRLKDHGLTRQALEAGEISQQHAQTIVGAGDRLPEGLSAAERARVESDLIDKAKTMAPAALRRQARRQLDALNRHQDEVDRHEDSQVATEEQRARARTRLILKDNNDGTVSGYFTVPVFHGHLLRKIIHTMTAPRRTNHTNSGAGAAFGTHNANGMNSAHGSSDATLGATGAAMSSGGRLVGAPAAGADADDGLFDLPAAGASANASASTHIGAGAGAGVGTRAGVGAVAGAGGTDQAGPARVFAVELDDLSGLPDPARVARARQADWANAHGLALAELIEHLPTDHLSPKTAATIIVTLEERVLRGHLAAADLDTGEKISATHARQLACNSGLIPAVLGGSSLPLDLGHGKRLFTQAQRTALATHYNECAAHNCTRPYAWCELHHAVPWSQGGPTDLNNAVPLCHRHHRMAHDHRYHHTRAPDGTFTFTMTTAA